MQKGPLGHSWSGQNCHHQGDSANADEELSEVIGIASRDRAKAQQAARALGIPKAYGSYTEMLADSETEAVYNNAAKSRARARLDSGGEAGRHVRARSRSEWVWRISWN